MDMNTSVVWLRAKEVPEMLEVKTHPTWWYFQAEVVNNDLYLKFTDSSKSITKRMMMP